MTFNADNKLKAYLKTKLSLEIGFTLIEVMVALVIVAVALSAASRSLGVTTNNQTLLEEKVIATWVAENAIIEQQVLGQTQSNKERIETMANRQWKVEYATEPTLIPEVYKLSVTVRDEATDSGAAQLFTVVGKPEL